MDDLQAVHTWASDAETYKYINPPNTELSQTIEHIKWGIDEWQSGHQTNYSFGISLNGNLIGEISCSFGCGKCGRCVKGEAAAGYVIYRDFWNCGYETEAVNALIEFFFKTLNAEKIIMSCDVKSISELRVIENIGMRLRLENEDCSYFDGRPFKRNTYVLDNPLISD
jgi:RimJ/RimL family protein N-acetyltransferase